MIGKGIAQFRIRIRELCIENHLTGIAEEMNVSGLKEYGATESVAQQVCASLDLHHQFSNSASPQEYCQLSIRQDNDIRVEHISNDWNQEQKEADVLARGSVPPDRIRGQYWLCKVQEFNVWPLLFIFGANHFTPFTTLLKDSCIHVVEADLDWKPSANRGNYASKA